MSEVNEIVDLLSDSFESPQTWGKLDDVIAKLPNPDDQIREWHRVVAAVESKNIPSGHPHFRLGILYLVNDSTETEGISHLELAYKQDCQHDKRNEPHRKGAYRVLALTKDFLLYLQSEARPWQQAQLQIPYRKTLIHILLAAYDQTAKNILDLPRLTYAPLFKLMSNDRLRAFAGENYDFAQELLERVSLESGQQLRTFYQYPIARTIIGLLGGVLEAILADRHPKFASKPLGKLIEGACNDGTISVGSRLAALASVILYLRNHIHPGREIKRIDYLVDLNVAKGCKIMLDWAIQELVASVATTSP